VPVAAARTYSQRGVITATPNDTSLGLTKWTRATPDVEWASAIPTEFPVDALAVMGVGGRRGSRYRGYHFTLGNLPPSENGCVVIAIDPRTAAARELCGSKRGDCHELE
jgi:hypothetical protein